MLLVSNPGLGSPPGKTKLKAIEEEPEEIKTFKVLNEGEEKKKTVAKLDKSSSENDSGCDDDTESFDYRSKKIAEARRMKAITGNISDSTEDLSGSESTTALSNSSKTAQSGHNSDSGNSTENSVASTESVLSLHPDDLDFDEKCTSALAKNIVKSNNSQCILAVKEYARDKLVQAVNGYKVRIAIIGELGAGKTTLIKEIFGGGPLKEAKSSKDKPTTSYKYPNHKNITFTEIPHVSSTRRADREEYMKNMKLYNFDLVLLLTDSHIREWSMWLGRQFNEKEIPFFYVRTKIDKTTAEDQAKFPRTYCEDRLVSRVRQRCKDSINTGKVKNTKAYVVSARNKDKWDFRALVQALGDELPKNKRRSLNICLPALTPHIIHEKQKAHAARIWMVAAISVASGVMDIPGFALSADVELLRRECHNYKHSFGITDGIMHKLCVDESNPALEAAWDLIFYDSGIHSILRQASIEIDPTDLLKFEKKVPLLGGGISFPATCSTLRFILQELAAMALRYVSQDLDECDSLDDEDTLSDISDMSDR